MNQRPILFRAFHTPTQTLFDVFTFLDDYVFENTMDGVETSDTNPAHRNDCILMQYSGIKTEDGTPIYEGDILKTVIEEDVKIVPSGQSVIYNEVTFQDGCFGYVGEISEEFQPFWMDGVKDGVYKDCSVAGNVHQDRHLLGHDPEEVKVWDAVRFKGIHNVVPAFSGNLTNWLDWQAAFVKVLKADEFTSAAIQAVPWDDLRENYFNQAESVLDTHKDYFYE